MTILEAITSSPINVFFTIVIGISLAYLYCRKPSNSNSTSTSSSSSSASSPSSATSTHHTTRSNLHNATTRSALGLDAGGVVDEELQRAIAQIERQERDMIRQEQDEAYQQSLRMDREKKLKREEEQRDKEARERTEREKKEQIERLHESLTKLKSVITDKLPNKPISSDQDIVKLVFKLPDGTRVKRDFSKTHKVKYLHWFVFSVENAPLQFKLTTNFPKRDLPGRPPLPQDFDASSSISTPSACSNEPNCELTLEEAGLTETQIIFVYDLEA